MITIKANINFSDFEPWSVYSIDTQCIIIEENKVEEFEKLLNQKYPNGISEQELDSLLVNERDFIFTELNIGNDKVLNNVKEFLDLLTVEQTNKIDIAYFDLFGKSISVNGKMYNFPMKYKTFLLLTTIK